jgi:hypothetical protein
MRNTLRRKGNTNSKRKVYPVNPVVKVLLYPVTLCALCVKGFSASEAPEQRGDDQQ